MTVNGATFAVPGLWSLTFGNGDSDKPVTTLFYTAGFSDQTDGVFGSIAVSSTPSIHNRNNPWNKLLPSEVFSPEPQL